jgi:ribosomal protein S6
LTGGLRPAIIPTIMKNYELTYLIPANIADEDKKRISEEISFLVQDKGGVLREGGVPIKRILPQPISGHGEVLSVSIDFYANPEKIQEIEAGLKEKKAVVRYMLVIKEKLSAPKPVRKRIKEEPQKKVDLKDIEDKIEEILKEE